jgi:hypothetical protein
MDTMFHLFTSDSKYMECSVTCGFVFRIFWSTRQWCVMKSTHVCCGRYGCVCVCFSRWVPMFQKSTLFQTFESALGGGGGDVNRTGSVASHGRRRQKVIQIHLRTHLKKRSDSLFTVLMCTGLRLTNCSSSWPIPVHSPVSCAVSPRSICFILVYLHIGFPSCLFTWDFYNWNLYAAYVSKHILRVLPNFFELKLNLLIEENKLRHASFSIFVIPHRITR